MRLLLLGLGPLFAVQSLIGGWACGFLVKADVGAATEGHDFVFYVGTIHFVPSFDLEVLKDGIVTSWRCGSQVNEVKFSLVFGYDVFPSSSDNRNL